MSLVIGVVVLYVTYLVFRTWFKKRYPTENDNLAFKILVAAILFSTGYCISGAIQSIGSTFKLLEAQGLSGGIYIFECIKYVVVYVIIGLVVSMLSNFITLIFYNSITRSEDELQEIANGKLSYAILMATIVIVISLFTKDAYINILESIMPYPDVPVLPR
ncbi:MAG: hypothetical protein E6H07_07770 [Bacteroidetes bacterium]|nr:MAG: hypothetical protein E6H07_07770 [Bacteroidota bacterium]